MRGQRSHINSAVPQMASHHALEPSSGAESPCWEENGCAEVSVHQTVRWIVVKDHDGLSSSRCQGVFQLVFAAPVEEIHSKGNHRCSGTQSFARA